MPNEVSKEEFLDWRLDPVTRIVFEIIDKHIQDLLENLSRNPGENPVYDSRLGGIIRGLEMVKEIRYDDKEELEA